MEGFDSTRPISLYIHIPFCSRKCDYCAFYSRAPEEGEIEKYFSLLMRELDAIKKDIQKPFHTIFIGGGNPGLLGWDRIKRLLECAEEFGKPVEVSMECNPENLNEGVRELIGVVDRISIGIQSMNDSVLKTLGRRLTRETNLKALELLSSLPFRWNADIITAVPGESIENTLNDIREISSFNPGHISFYCLTFEEGTPILGRCTPIGESEEAKFLLEGWKALEEKGYSHYEVSNFARKGEECIHNQVYWNLGQYIGLGPTAESSLGYHSLVSMRNCETLEEYYGSQDFQCFRLNGIEAEESYLLTVLRTREGLDKQEYKKRFLMDFDQRYQERISLLDKELYINDENRFYLTEKGILVLDSIILSLALAI